MPHTFAQKKVVQYAPASSQTPVNPQDNKGNPYENGQTDRSYSLVGFKRGDTRVSVAEQQY